MKIIFVRHADPDYAKDSLTEKGFKEAKLLADYMENVKVDKFYCSPLGRAVATADITLAKKNMDKTVHEWLKEFYVTIKDPVNGHDRIPWDFFPSYWTKKTELYDKDKWLDSDVMSTGNVKEEYQKVANGIDAILSDHGYEREGNYYKVKKANTDTIAIYCHLGVSFVMLSHLLGIPAPVLWQGFFVAPSSITILETEERVEGEACFRCKCLGSTTHLHVGNEPPSNSGFFQETYK